MTSQYRQGTKTKQQQAHLGHFAAEMFARQRVAQLVQHLHDADRQRAARPDSANRRDAESSGRRARNSSKWPTTIDAAKSTISDGHARARSARRASGSGRGLP